MDCPRERAKSPLGPCGARVVTRDEIRHLERQLAERYPDVSVARVFGGVEVQAGDASGWIFLRTTGDSPLLTLLAEQRLATRGVSDQ